MKNIKYILLALVLLTPACLFAGCSAVRVREAGPLIEMDIEAEETEPAAPAIVIVGNEIVGNEINEKKENEGNEGAVSQEDITAEDVIEYGANSVEAPKDCDTAKGDTEEEKKAPAADTAARPPRDPNEKLIALTFDDGPSRHTRRILEALEEHGGQATFFVLGSRVWNYREVVKSIIEQGSEVAGHSWHHLDFTLLDEQEVKDQIIYTDNAISNITGIPTPPFIRAPFGHFNESVMRTAKEHGVALIQWSVDTLDWRHRNADFIFEYIMQNAGNGSIILAHDLYESTAAAMERAIPALIEQGYRLVTVSYLLGETVPGRVYYSETRSIGLVNRGPPPHE